MVRQAEIPFDCVRGRFVARGLERRVFPRFAQGAVRPGCADVSTIGEPALLAATRGRRSQRSRWRRRWGPRNYKQSQFSGTGSRRAWPALQDGRRNAGGLAGGPVAGAREPGMSNKVCAKVSWCNSAGLNPARPQYSRPAGIDVVVSGGNEWCEALRIADGQPQRK